MSKTLQIQLIMLKKKILVIELEVNLVVGTTHDAVAINYELQFKSLFTFLSDHRVYNSVIYAPLLRPFNEWLESK